MASQKSTGKPRLSGSTSLSQSKKGTSRSSKVAQEKQGPIDWSSRGLKSKYRGEAEREAAWKLWLSASQYALKTLSENDFIIPTVKVERHPFYVSYYKHLEKENAMSSTRTMSRLLMKRFVFDVQEIWLTNLEHLREHNAANMYNEPDAGNEKELARHVNEKEDANRGNGLHNRRDVRALESMDSQIQSVSQKRAFANAYHTARLPNIQVVLDYEPRPTAHLHDIKCLPPTIEPLVRGLRLSPAVSGDGLTMVPVLHSEARFPNLVYVLHIDRLLPSSDYLQQEVMGEVLWRFSLYRNDNSSAVQYYISREAEVAEFASSIILCKTQQQQNQQDTSAAGMASLPSHLLCSGMVYNAAEPVPLPCIDAFAGTAKVSAKEAVAFISVAVLGMSRPLSTLKRGAVNQQASDELCFDCVHDQERLSEHASSIIVVKIEICVTLLASTTDGRTMNEHEFLVDGEHRKVFLECSPAELRYLLRESPAAAEAPLGGGAGIFWWLQGDRSADLWPLLAQHLVLECTPTDDGEVQYALGFTSTTEQRQERSSRGSGVAKVCAEQVSGALTTLEALSCAYEILDVVRLVQQQPPASAAPFHTLHLEGSPHSFFSHVELPRQFSAFSRDASENGGDKESISPIPPSTPLLYFDNQQSVATGRLIGSLSGSRAASPSKEAMAARGPSSPQHHHDQHQHPHRIPKSKRIMAAVDERARTQVQTGFWEAVEDTGLNLSMIIGGSLPTITLVPGACEYGRKGIWFPDHNTAPVEYTQAAARFFREPRATSSRSILVNMTFALDTSLLFDPVLAWEAFSSYPAPTPAEEVDGVIPALTAPPNTLRGEALVSPIEQRLSAPVMIFAAIPVEGVDFMPLDTPTLPKGFRRHIPTKNRYGYREQIEVTLLGVDPVLATVVFGITRTGAVPNNAGVNNRNIWHNTLAITEHINRPRAPKDYHYILIRAEHNGSNEPTRYTTRMRGDKMVGLTSSAFSTYEDNYAAIQQLRDIFNKQVALDAKIEKVENDIMVKHALEKIHFQNQLQRALEKKMRKATKSELGWRSRFKMSTLLEIQGNWERRRDDRTGMSFFRNLGTQPQMQFQQLGQEEAEGYYASNNVQKEQFMQTCQWEVPAQWDGDPLSTDVSGGREYAHNLYPGHNTKHKGEHAYNQKRAGGGGGNASFGSLSGADYMSDMHEEELDPFDMAPARWDPNPPQHKQQIQQQATAALKLPSAKGAFEQPPDSWMPTNALIGGDSVAGMGNTGGSIAQSITSSPNHARPPRGTKSVRSDASSAIDSVQANRSLAESAAPTIDTANLEHIAEQLVSSDELMRVIARRLGIPESQVVPADELSSVFSVSTAGRSSQGAGALDDRQNPLMAPRDPWVDTLDEPEFDSDDDLWSDDEHEVGDFDDEKEIGLPEDMPTTQLEAAQLRRRELREIRGNRTEIASVPSHIPALDLRHMNKPLKDGEVDIEGDVASDMAREEVFGWRRLPRPVIRPGFLSDALLTHTKPPDATSSNTLNAPVFLMPISPVDACKYYPEEFTTAIESIFIPDAKKDMERSIATVERNIRREEELTRNLPTDDLLLFGEATEFTSADAFLARQRKEDLDQVRDPAEEAREKAILAAKSSNIAMMEDSLAMDADPNTTDEFGNTLLILAAQQGAKRMCKFLLRKGANINKQSIVGNTPLHYCYAYGNNALGEYLKAKGADDSIVNVDKLTCYEGLSMDSMKEFYGDDEEAHMIMGPPPGQGNDGEDSD